MAKFNKSKHKNYIDRKGRLHKKPSSINISPKFFNRDFTLLNNIPAPGEGFPPGINNWIQYYEWLQTSSEGNYYLEQIDILLDQGYSCDQIGFSRYIPGDVNGDGTLNVLDIVGLVGVILGGDAFDLSSHPCFGKFVDLNGDGSSNVLDIVNLINSILSPSGGYADDYCDDEDALNYGSPGGCYYSCIGSSNNPEFLGDQSVNTPCCITEDIFVNESRRGDCSDGSDPDPCGWCLGDPLYNLVYSTCTILGEFDQNWLATCPEDQPCCAYNAFFARKVFITMIGNFIKIFMYKFICDRIFCFIDLNK